MLFSVQCFPLSFVVITEQFPPTAIPFSWFIKSISKRPNIFPEESAFHVKPASVVLIITPHVPTR